MGGATVGRGPALLPLHNQLEPSLSVSEGQGPGSKSPWSCLQFPLSTTSCWTQQPCDIQSLARGEAEISGKGNQEEAEASDGGLK